MIPKETFMKRNGYNYYVMVGMQISYFVEKEEAEFYAEQFGVEVKEMW